MTHFRVYPREIGYRVTDKAREALETAATCQCNQLWVSDGVYQCHECGTIFGVVYGLTLTPRKLRGNTVHH